MSGWLGGSCWSGNDGFLVGRLNHDKQICMYVCIYISSRATRTLEGILQQVADFPQHVGNCLNHFIVLYSTCMYERAARLKRWLGHSINHQNTPPPIHISPPPCTQTSTERGGRGPGGPPPAAAGQVSGGRLDGRRQREIWPPRGWGGRWGRRWWWRWWCGGAEFLK